MKRAPRILSLLGLLAASGVAGAAIGHYLLLRPQPEEAPANATPAPGELVYERHAVFDAADAAPSGTPLAARAEDEGGPVAPAHWANVNREAIAALDRGELERAVKLFEQCATAVPDQPRFRQNQAEALARLAVRDYEAHHPCEACTQDLQRAIELDPEREDLTKLLSMWTREAEVEKDFWEESSPHFDLSYDGSRGQLLWGSSRILNGLEKAYTDLGEVFGFYPVESGRPLIRVVLYEREGFSSLTGLGDWAGGAFDGTVRVPVGDLKVEEKRLDRILRHEVVHAFVREVGGVQVPGWLNEGLAQWLEGQRTEQVSAAREALAGRTLFPLERLQGSLATWSDPAEIALAYHQSLLLCDFVAERYGERALFDMVRGCREKVAPAATFESSTRVPLADVVEDLQHTL